METTLAQLKTQIDELEKRIKALSNQVTTQGYMTGLKTCLENIQSLFTTYQEQLNKHLEDYKTHTDAYDLHIADYEQIAQTVESIQTQINSLSSTLDSLEGVSADVEDLKGDISTINSTLATLGSVTQDISDLESAVATINSTISGLSNVSTDISNLKSDVNEINTTLSQLNEVSADMENLQDDIASINSTLSSMSGVSQDIEDIEDDITTINSSISSLSSSISDLEDADSALSSRITTLENASSSGSGGQTGGESSDNETAASYDSWQKDSAWALVHQPDSSGFSTPKCQFKCKPNTRVILSFELNGAVLTAGTASATRYIRFYLNEDKVKDINLNYSPTDFTFYGSYSFIATKAYNYFSVYSLLGSLQRYKSYTLSVEGVNVQILNKDLPITIRCFNDNYYILKKDKTDNNLYYAIQPKNSLNTNESSMTKIEYADLPCPIAYEALVPNTKVVNGVVQFDENYESQFKIAGIEAKKEHKVKILKYQSNEWSIDYDWDALNTTCAEYICGGIGKPPTSATTPDGNVMFVVDYNGLVGFVGGGTNNEFFISINNNFLYSSNYRMGAVVRDNNNKIGSPSDFRGVIVYDITSMKNIFIPQETSSYIVEIADGGNVTAFYQTDGSINVYLNRGANVYKYVLQKNSSGQYELNSTVTKIENATRYEELYDGKYIVYRDMEWEIN